MRRGKIRRIAALILAVIMISVPTLTAFALKAGDAIVEADETSELPDKEKEWNSDADIRLGGKNVHTSYSMGDDDIDPYEGEDEQEDLLKASFMMPLFAAKGALLGAGSDSDGFDYSKNKTYVEMIMEVTRVTKLNPFVTVSMIIQEQGRTATTPMVTGEGKNGKYKGIYNFTNYQAYATKEMGAQERGLWWASGAGEEKPDKGRPWDSPERAIFRGMGIYTANYLEMGQETFYYKKFNTNPASWEKGHWMSGNTFVPAHQYMTNLTGGMTEGQMVGKVYIENKLDDNKLTFYIPVYKGMPENPGTPYEKNDDKDLAAQKIEKDFKGCPGYTERLLLLHEKHPNWIFEKIETPASYNNTDTSWDSIVNGESAKGQNVIQKNGSWVDATKEEAEYYLDPRNFLKDESCVYQFLYQGYNPGTDTYMNANNVTKMVAGTFLGDKVKRYESSGGDDDSDDDNSGDDDSGSGGGSGSGGSGSGGGGTGGGGSGGGGTGGGGGGGGGSAGPGKDAEKGPDNGAPAYSPRWQKRADGKWFITRTNGEIVTNAWLCDDVISSNGKKVWYLLQADGTMLTAGLVQDKTGNFYSMEMDPHNQHYGMLRYKSGYYDCGGQQIYLELEENNVSSLGAIRNADAIEKLKSIYGLTIYPIGNETATYTSNL